MQRAVHSITSSAYRAWSEIGDLENPWDDLPQQFKLLVPELLSNIATTPVTLPPGRDKQVASPLTIGSLV